jgi:hypothetical protein
MYIRRPILCCPVYLVCHLAKSVLRFSMLQHLFAKKSALLRLVERHHCGIHQPSPSHRLITQQDRLSGSIKPVAA